MVIQKKKIKLYSRKVELHNYKTNPLKDLLIYIKNPLNNISNHIIYINEENKKYMQIKTNLINLVLLKKTDIQNHSKNNANIINKKI